MRFSFSFALVPRLLVHGQLLLDPSSGRSFIRSILINRSLHMGSCATGNGGELLADNSSSTCSDGSLLNCGTPVALLRDGPGIFFLVERWLLRLARRLVTTWAHSSSFLCLNCSVGWSTDCIRCSYSSCLVSISTKLLHGLAKKRVVEWLFCFQVLMSFYSGGSCNVVCAFFIDNYYCFNAYQHVMIDYLVIKKQLVILWLDCFSWMVHNGYIYIFVVQRVITILGRVLHWIDDTVWWNQTIARTHID